MVSIVNNIGVDINNTKELKVTEPVGKVLLNTLIKEKSNVASIKFGINQVTMKKAMVITPAII